MNPALWGVAIAATVYVGMVASLDVGYRLGARKSSQPELVHEGISGIEAAVFALLGLLLAFTFGGGTSRLDTRRQLIVQEANAIGTAYLRLDLLPADAQPGLRQAFRTYLDARLLAYEKLPDLEAAEKAFIRAGKMQQEIWSRGVSASRAEPTQTASRLLLPALNEMIDVTTSRTVALHTKMPPLIFGMLLIVALLSGLVAGYAMAKRKSRSWLHTHIYALVIAITIYAVLDLNNPNAGFIRLRAAEQALLELRDSIRQ